MGKTGLKWLLAAVVGVSCLGALGCWSGESGPGSAGQPEPVVIEEDTTDGMWSDEVADAEFYVFQIDGRTLTVDDTYDVDVYGSAQLQDGGFYRVVADVTYLNGGVAGYVDYPQVNAVKSCEEVSPLDIGLPTLDQSVYGLVLIGDYADGDVLVNEYSLMGVWKDGEWAYRYDEELDLASGPSALVRGDVSEADVQAGIDAGILSCEDYFVLPSEGAAAE